jgi:MtN3 and saliva related transmembrane protein
MGRSPVRDEWFGYLGGTMTTVAFFPQVVKTLRTRDTRSISLGMYLLFTAGVFFWLVYGIRLGALPMILANGITLLLSFVLLVAKWRWK